MTISNDKLLLSQKEAQLRQRIINLTLGQAELFIQVSALRAELESIAQKHPNKTNGSDFNTAIHELLTLADQCIHPSLILTNSKIFFAEDDVTTTQCNTVTLSNLIDQITNKIVVLDIPEFTEIKNILNKILAYYTQYSQQVLAAKLGEDSKSLKKLMESKAVLINEEGDCYEIPMKIAYEILGIDRHGNSAATRELGTHRVARLKTKDGDIHCKSSSISDIKPAAEKAAYFLAKALGFNILSPIESVFLVGLRFQRPQKLGSSSLIENFDQAYTTLVQMSFTIDGINIEHLLNAYNTYQTIDLACRNFSYDRQKNLYSFKIIFDSIRSNQYFNNYITTEAASIANIITADAEYVARAVLKGMATIDPQNRPKDFNDLNKSYVKQIENINDIISKRPRTENSNSINEIILKGVAFVATWPELTQGKEFVEVISLVNELEQAANLFKKFSTDEFILFMNNFYSRFDKVSYSQHSIFDIIIGTSDAKPSNHMAEVIPSNRSWAATGIDNDEFTEQTVAIDREGTHVNCFRSFFPTLPQREEAIEPSSIARCKVKLAETIMLDFFVDMQQWHKKSQAQITQKRVTLSPYSEISPHHFYVASKDIAPQISRPMVNAWFNKIKIFTQLLSENTILSIDEIFEKLEPLAFLFYKTVLSKSKTQPFLNINEIYAQIYSVENSFENLFSTENNGTKVMDSEVKAKLERAAVKIESHENDNNNTDSNLSSLDDLAKDFIQNMDFNPFNTEQFIASLFKIKEHFSVKKFKTLTPEIVRRHIFSIMRAPHPELFCYLTEIENFDPNMSVDKNGNTALHFLLQQDTQSQGVRQMIRALLKLRNTNIYSTNNEKRIPIFLAKKMDRQLVQMFVQEKNYNINIRDINGQSVFEYAIDQPIEKMDLELIEHLIFELEVEDIKPADYFAFLDKIQSNQKLMLRLKKLTNTLGWYTRLYEITTTTPQTQKIFLASNKPSGQNMGQRYLKEEIYNTIFKKDHRINTQNDYGRSDVTTATMGGAVFVFKTYPDFPLNELSYRWLYNNLLKMLDLKDFKRLYSACFMFADETDKLYPVLISDFIEGTNLKNALINKTANLDQISPESVFVTSFLATITIQRDQNPSNFILRNLSNDSNDNTSSTQYEISPCDSDRMGRTLYSTNENQESELNVNAFPLYLNQIKTKYKFSFRERIVHANLQTYFKNWLLWLNDHYHSLISFQRFLNKRTTHNVFEISLTLDSILFITEAFSRTQALMMKQGFFSIQELLENISPSFGCWLTQIHSSDDPPNVKYNRATEEFSKVVKKGYLSKDDKAFVSHVQNENEKIKEKKAKLPITPSAAADIVDNFFKQTQEIQNIILRVKSGDYQVLETIISPEVIEKVLAEIKISNLSAQLQSSLFGIISKLAHRRLNLLVFSKIDISDDELEVVLKNSEDLESLKLGTTQLSTNTLKLIKRYCPGIKSLTLSAEPVNSVKMDFRKQQKSNKRRIQSMIPGISTNSIKRMLSFRSPALNFEKLQRVNLNDINDLDKITLHCPRIISLKNMPALENIVILEYESLEQVEIKNCPKINISFIREIRLRNRNVKISCDHSIPEQSLTLWSVTRSANQELEESECSNLIGFSDSLILNGSNPSRSQLLSIFKHPYVSKIKALYARGCPFANYNFIVQVFSNTQQFPTVERFDLVNYHRYKHSQNGTITTKDKHHQVRHAEFGPDDNLYVLTAFENKYFVKKWDIRGDTALESPELEKLDNVTHFCFLHSGELVVVQNQKTLKLYNLNNGKEETLLDNPPHPILSVTSKGDLILANTTNKALILVYVRPGLGQQKLKVLNYEHHSVIKCMTFINNEKILLGTQNGYVTTLNIKEFQFSPFIKIHSKAITALNHYSRDSNLYMSSSDDGYIKVFELATINNPDKPLKIKEEIPSLSTSHPDNNNSTTDKDSVTTAVTLIENHLIAFSVNTFDKKLQRRIFKLVIYDDVTKFYTELPDFHEYKINQLLISPMGNLVSIGSDGKIKTFHFTPNTIKLSPLPATIDIAPGPEKNALLLFKYKDKNALEKMHVTINQFLDYLAGPNTFQIMKLEAPFTENDLTDLTENQKQQALQYDGILLIKFEQHKVIDSVIQELKSIVYEFIKALIPRLPVFNAAMTTISNTATNVGPYYIIPNIGNTPIITTRTKSPTPASTSPADKKKGATVSSTRVSAINISSLSKSKEVPDPSATNNNTIPGFS